MPETNRAFISKVDESGRIVIPKDVRDAFKIHPKDYLEMKFNRIALRTAATYAEEPIEV